MKQKLKRFSLLQGLLGIYRNYFSPYRKKLGYCAEDASMGSPRLVVGYENIYMSENTGIGANATILTPHAKFIIKKNSGCAAGLFVATGNHERRVGRFYRTITEDEKSPGLDRDIIIEEDCWIGGNVALLSGVTVKRGTTVGNGSVLTRDTVPYSIWAGVPARFIKFYWTIDQIIAHEIELYPENERLTREYLESIYLKYHKIDGTKNKL